MRAFPHKEPTPWNKRAALRPQYARVAQSKNRRTDRAAQGLEVAPQFNLRLVNERATRVWSAGFISPSLPEETGY